MYKDLEFAALWNEIKHQANLKADFVIAAPALSMAGGLIHVDGGKYNETLQGVLDGTGVFSKDLMVAQLAPNQTMHRQLAEKLDIPGRYYQRMLEDAPGLLDRNVSDWLAHLSNAGKNYFIRTFASKEPGTPGIARAILSDRYQTIDNIEVVAATMKAVKKAGVDVKFDPSDITEDALFLRVIAPEIEDKAESILREYKVPGDRGRSSYRGDGICTGFILRNSEVGMGRFQIAPRLVVGRCSNGMIFTNEAFNKTHLGAKLDAGQAVRWSEQTERANMDLIVSQIQDAVTTFLSPKFLGTMIHTLGVAAAHRVENVSKGIANVSMAMGMTEKEMDALVDSFSRGGDQSALGMAQAITYVAQGLEPQKRYDWEVGASSIARNFNKWDVAVELNDKAAAAILN